MCSTGSECANGVCVDGVCVPDNSDSGVGGGGGTGAPVAFHCSSTRTVASFDGPIVDAGYYLYNWLLLGAPDPRSLTDGGTWEQLELELNTGLRPNQPIPGPVDDARVLSLAHAYERQSRRFVAPR